MKSDYGNFSVYINTNEGWRFLNLCNLRNLWFLFILPG